MPTENGAEARMIEELRDDILSLTPEVPASQPDGVVVPREIDRSKHRYVLSVWNRCMWESATLETAWPLLVEAMLAASKEESSEQLRADGLRISACSVDAVNREERK